MRIEIDEEKMKVLVEAWDYEQDWGDYADEIDSFVEDVISKNPEVKKWVKCRKTA